MKLLSDLCVIELTKNESYMKIILLSGANSPHTLNWANSLVKAGHNVHVASQHKETTGYDDRVNIIRLPNNGILGFLSSIIKLRKVVKKIKPDIINAHRAARYSLIATLIDFRPIVISVWGSDVYDFPHKSLLHKWFVRTNLYAADAVASTSLCMAEETRKLAPKLSDIAITPFGVDMAAYAGIEPVVAENNEQLIVGTVKSMASKYGIDTLIDAFALLLKKLQTENPELAAKLMLRLVGGGPQAAEYQQQANRLGIAEQVELIGRVPHTQVPNELAKLDIYVALSRLDSESFGVAIIEAGAAGRPVVVSDAGGLPEVTLENKTGLIVPRENPQAAADAIEKLVLNPQQRREFGIAGREHVAKIYDWSICVNTMISVYEKVIAKNLSKGAKS